MPPGETLAAFAATGATLAVHLAVNRLPEIVAALLPFYGPECPAAVAVRVSWPEEALLRGTLSTIEALLAASPAERTGLVLVGPALAGAGGESALYSADYVRRFRAASPSPSGRGAG